MADRLVPYRPPGASDIFNKNFVPREGGLYYAEEIALGGSSTPVGGASGSSTFLGQVGGRTALVDLIFSLTTGTYYVAGDVFDDVQPLLGLVRIPWGTGALASILVFNDDDAADLALDFIFFNQSGTIGTQDAACSISDAYAHSILGYVSFATTDFTDLGGVRVASKKVTDVSYPVQGDNNGNVWVASIYRGTSGTYTANGVRAKFGSFQD